MASQAGWQAGRLAGWQAGIKKSTKLLPDFIVLLDKVEVGMNAVNSR